MGEMKARDKPLAPRVLPRVPNIKILANPHYMSPELTLGAKRLTNQTEKCRK